MTINDVNDYLNKKSGILGVSGVSSDFRDVCAAADEGNKRAQLAIEIFCYRVRKYIGEYAAVLGGLDAVVFTAGIGENVGVIRGKILEGMEYMGLKIDSKKNEVRGQERDISTPDASIKTLVIPTNEELAIARETAMLVK